MKKFFVIAALALFSPVVSAAQDVVGDFSERVAASRVSFDYTYKLEEQGIKFTGKGSVVLQDSSYFASSGAVRMWCDGQSVWTVDDEAGEVVIEPVVSGSGVLINPVSVISSLPYAFKWDERGEESEFEGIRTTLFHLVSQNDSDLQEVRLYFSTDNIPVGAEMQTDNGVIAFAISSLTFRMKKDDGMFVPPSFGPEFIVTDLR